MDGGVIRCEMASADWKMAVCLLASVRQKTYRHRNYPSITAYAEESLQLHPQKTGELIHTAEVLEKLPALSEAFRTAQIGWGKMRELKRVATPETEASWLEFALAHSTAEVRNKVSLSPREWKRSQALQASQTGTPTATVEAVMEVLEQPTHERPSAPVQEDSVCARSTLVDGAPVLESQSSSELTSGEPTLPAAQRIRVVFYMTPDQYALYEEAESRVRARLNKRVPREEVLAELAKVSLDQGAARARARHQVLIHTRPETGQAWYDTERGPLPVDPAVVEQAQTRGPAVKVTPVPPCADPPRASTPEAAEPEGLTRASSPGKSVTGSRPGRKAIPNPMLREVFARAGNRCERCGRRGGRLHAHHKEPVSDGGQNRAVTLTVLCSVCHSLVHQDDFETRPQWRRARRAAEARRRKEPETVANGP